MGLFGWLKRLFGGETGGPQPNSTEVRNPTDDSPRVGNESTDDSAQSEEGAPPTGQAMALVDEAAEAGYDLDFSPASLTALDSLVEDLTEEERVTFSRPIVAYLGEVFVQNYDGEWTVVDEIGWLVDLSEGMERVEENLFAIPQATMAVMEGDETFASVHDQTVVDLEVDAPTLSDEPITPQAGPDGEPLHEAARREYREKAKELVEAWPAYDLDYSPESLAKVDDLIADNYDMSPDDVDREKRLSEGPPGGVPEGANVTVGTGAATTQIAAYVGELFSREYGAEWYAGAFDSIVIETTEQTIEFEPEYTVNFAYHGWISFEKLHGALVAEQDLTVDG